MVPRSCIPRQMSLGCVHAIDNRHMGLVKFGASRAIRGQRNTQLALPQFHATTGIFLFTDPDLTRNSSQSCRIAVPGPGFPKPRPSS